MLVHQLSFRQLPWPLLLDEKIAMIEQYLHEEALALGYSYDGEREFAIDKALKDGLIDRRPYGDEFIYRA